MELRTYRYRIYPSQKQKIKFNKTLVISKLLYNELLSLSKDSWKYGNVTLNKFDLDKCHTGKYLEIHSKIKSNISGRVNKTFQNFFRRVKQKSKKKGFPRYKSRVNSFNYSNNGFKILSNKNLKIGKIGIVPITLHRPPKGRIVNVTIKRNNINQWFASFVCETKKININHHSNKKVGVDVGLKNYAVLSTGEFIKNPRHINKTEKRLKSLHRRFSKKKKGSKNSRKARLKLAKLHLKVSNQRTDFLHKLSYKITT